MLDDVGDKSNSFKDDGLFLGTMYVIWSSYLSWADVSSLEPAQTRSRRPLSFIRLVHIL
jgi:hypothetical protein